MVSFSVTYTLILCDVRRESTPKNPRRNGGGNALITAELAYKSLRFKISLSVNVLH